MGFIIGEINGVFNESLRDDSALDIYQHQDRQARFFPLFSVVRFKNSECSGNSGNTFRGTCFTKNECAKYGGISSGSCANKLGVCCTFRKECGTTSNVNNTYFVNPGFYSSYEGGERCVITINKCNSNICQLRIDFLELSLSQPNGSGVCDYDFLLISGGSTSVPRICGDNSKQHVYVEFFENNPITISINTNAEYKFGRKWNLRIRQIACDSPWRAPTGCLQYYNTTSGSVTSFNYGTTTNPRASILPPLVGTRQLQNLNYGVCIRMALGYCTIEWSQSETNSFSISGDSSVVDYTPGIDYSSSGVDCDHNYVIIPNPSINGSRETTDRYCGNGFSTKTSKSKPFVLYIVTNTDPRANGPSTDPNAPSPDLENRGFILNYRQILCDL
ncbi:hypothetical protein HCN44_007227 [Aphidius gifuensis]|uniref:CUB domain-containing protein n=2 Tax=Aphidius gifuensis TaxID=684658 RepID=A0A834XL77_APHGI|nr:hypothetical protein HCN44_007227 [Aphidius gifuensis]